MRATRFGLPVLLALASLGPASLQVHASGSALLVCNASSIGCPAGTAGFSSIQAAVDAAEPGDWVLVWPGTYHEKGSAYAGVTIKTPNLHLRGMDRNLVVVDGSNGTNAPCPSDESLQDFNGGHGRNGIVAYQATGNWIENLTVCNYLSGATGGAGNEIWWNGGDGSAAPGDYNYWGNWLSATSTYFPSNATLAAGNGADGQYGIFVSNINSETGPASSLNYDYASNMGDSAFYVGACSDCNTTLNHVIGAHSSLGYSGTNSGGRLVIKNSEFADNKTGIVPNSLNNDDAPSPQSGACPGATADAFGIIASCTFIEGNSIHDNNDPNVPAVGISGNAPVGAGIELVGTRFDTLTGNLVYNQGSWGIVVHDYPDTETPPAAAIARGEDCNGGIPGPTPLHQAFCYYQGIGNQVVNNMVNHNGFFGNPTNADLALQASGMGNCFSNNGITGYTPTSDPPAIQVVDSNCDGPTVGDSGALTAELVCASQLFGACPDPASGNPPVFTYPRITCDGVGQNPPAPACVIPLPQEPTMADPCAPDALGNAVPANPWCPDYTGPRSPEYAVTVPGAAIAGRASLTHETPALANRRTGVARAL
ncbi:MAG: hypothetical protein ACYDAY_09880 [Candidatus Dormibacteria bacterium]